MDGLPEVRGEHPLRVEAALELEERVLEAAEPASDDAPRW